MYVRRVSIRPGSLSDCVGNVTAAATCQHSQGLRHLVKRGTEESHTAPCTQLHIIHNFRTNASI